jgi:hypothetical protein
VAVDIAAEDPLAPDRWTAEAGGGKGRPPRRRRRWRNCWPRPPTIPRTEVEVGDVLAGLTMLRLLTRAAGRLGAAPDRCRPEPGCQLGGHRPGPGRGQPTGGGAPLSAPEPEPGPQPHRGAAGPGGSRPARGDRAVAGWARHNSARLRRLAAQITSLDDLDARARPSVDRLEHSARRGRLGRAAGAPRRGGLQTAGQSSGAGDAGRPRSSRTPSSSANECAPPPPTRNQTTRGEPL